MLRPWEGSQEQRNEGRDPWVLVPLCLVMPGRLVLFSQPVSPAAKWGWGWGVVSKRASVPVLTRKELAAGRRGIPGLDGAGGQASQPLGSRTSGTRCSLCRGGCWDWLSTMERREGRGLDARPRGWGWQGKRLTGEG